MSDEHDSTADTSPFQTPAPVVGPVQGPTPPPGVILREDGFFGIESFPDDVYYDDFATARRIGAWVTEQNAAKP